jgi:predicted acetyltransferase
MTTLLRPDADRFDDWVEMLADYEEPVPPGSGLWLVEGDAARERFEAHVAKSRLYADADAVLPEDKVHADQYWVADDAGVLVGFLQLRHTLNDFLLHGGGHIGYSVRVSRRREGHASRALGLALVRSRELGLDRVLLVCDDDNLASATTIESQGGVLEDVRPSHDGKGLNRRYWIDL